MNRPRVKGFASAAAVAALASGLVVSGCQPSGDGSGGSAARTAESDVRAASLAWDQAHNAGDLAALVDLYGENAVSMPYGRAALEGRDAIAEDFRLFFDGFTATHRTEILSITVVDDVAIERGRYQLSVTPRAAGAPASESGKHIVIRRRVNGAWKIQYEIWNTDA